MGAYRHVQRLELACCEQKRTGGLMSVLNDDINQMERFLNGGANDLIQVLTSTVLVAGVFFVLAPQIALLALVPILARFTVTLLYGGLMGSVAASGSAAPGDRGGSTAQSL